MAAWIKQKTEIVQMTNDQFSVVQHVKENLIKDTHLGKCSSKK